MNPDEVTDTQRKLLKTDKLLSKLTTVFIVFLMVMIGILIVQTVSLQRRTVTLQNTIITNQATNTKASADRFAKYQVLNQAYHRQTQQYVRCIAQTLLLPIEQRTEAQFDSCSQPLEGQQL